MLDKLFQSIRIGNVELKNRIALSPMALYYAPGGMVSERLKNFYVERAKGGAGLIMCTFSVQPVPQEGYFKNLFPSIYNDKQIPVVRDLVRAIHDCGAKVGIQFFTPADRLEGSVGPSSVEVLREGMPPIIPRTLTITEIRQAICEVGDAAYRAREAGFDLVEFHALGGECLMSRFLAPLTNKRTDEYGGSIENRWRFVLEALADCRQKAGDDYTFIARIPGESFREDAPDLEEQKYTAPLLEKAGFHALDIKPGRRGSKKSITFLPEGGFVYIASEIKKVVNIPVITGTRFVNPVLANKVISEQKADMVYMARALIADPELPNKAREGKLNEIRPCIACQGCWNDIEHWREVTCSVNVRAGREGDQNYSIVPCVSPKKLLILGGGPAGMEAARIAALRGHEVILYEKAIKLGGLLPLAVLVKGAVFQDFLGLVRYLSTEIARLGVKIRMRTEATLEVIKDSKPNTVVLAIGGQQSFPEIPGIENKKVITSATLHKRVKPFLKIFGPKVLRWLAKIWLPVGKRVVVIGGDIQGLEVAEFLVKRGRQVTIVEASGELGKAMYEYLKNPLLDFLSEKSVVMLTDVKFEEVIDEGLVITTKEKKRQILIADNILVTMPSKPNIELYKKLEGKYDEILIIGDCKEPHLVREAIHDGFHIGRTI
jgi:2,4-dienoyl-CoA reductase (NADPH2)